MTTALLEIGMEHLPARFLKPTLAQLETSAKAMLAERRLGFSSVRATGTFRRLALYIEGVEAASPDMEKEALGPAASKWKTPDGKFTPQSEGFARGQGTTADKLYIVNSPAKGEVLAVKKLIKGEPAPDILAEIFPKLVASLQFPKNMVWEETEFRFARPIRMLLGLYGSKLVEFEVAGVRSAKKTAPLALVGAKPLTVSEPEEYAGLLRNEGIMLEPADRKTVLCEQVQQAAARLGGKALLDEGLVDETVCFTENPVPATADFSVRYLKLPPELIITVLKRQLKFFPVLDAAGELQPHFIAVRDGSSENQDEVCRGFEAVVDARLSDAVFFFEKDLSHKLGDMRERLATLQFQEKLGSMQLKSERVEKLAMWICEAIRQDMHLDEAAVAQAARFAYADLTSEVVREFPELQGYMGGEYAAHGGENSRAALAIKEFYFPLTAKSELPTTLEGAVVSLAGKIDTLVSDFALDMAPTGSEDPFALRRQATGAVRILMEKALPLAASAIVAKAYELLPEDFRKAAGQKPADKKSSPLPGREKVLAAVEEFMWQRAETLLVEKDFGADEIRAVRRAQFDGETLSRPMTYMEVFFRVCALHNMRKNAEFAELSASFKRVANIVRKSGGEAGDTRVNADLFAAEQEGALYTALKTVRGKTAPYLGSSIKASQEDYENCLREFVTLKVQIDAFFDAVMVMDKDAAVRANRLALLGELYTLFSSIADLSQLQ
jgi:glycyl-tRNA synthetase beta chain